MNKQATTPKLVLIDHIETIVELARDSKLTPEFYKQAQKHTKYVAQKLDLTPQGAVLVALFINASDDRCIELSDLASFTKCSIISLIKMMSGIEVLAEKKYIRSYSKNGKWQFSVPFEFVESVRKELPYEPMNYRELDKHSLFFHIGKLFKLRKNSEITFQAMLDDLECIVTNNPQLSFCKAVHKRTFLEVDLDIYFVVFVFFCAALVNDNDNCIRFYEFSTLLDEECSQGALSNEMHSGECQLMRDPWNFIEFTNDNGLEDRTEFCLTTKAREEFLMDYNLKTTQSKAQDDLLQHTKLPNKELYYNQRETTQIDKLSELLAQDHFVKVQERLEQNGLRRGFACLFYGAPGTGKTETVYQIARRTGRDIMVVDVSQIKAKWVGDSEKNIKAIFDRYRKRCKESPVTPILLFNEADAVIGIRSKGAERAVDKMENSIQNIILQEMEILEGIMIATTNLTENLDKAFERRFLYKIEFDRPEVEAKLAIWRSMIPTLAEDQVAELASNYPFSGGQIENIARKRTVDAILLGCDSSLEDLHDYCQTELLVKQNSARKIGY